ncbi:hypothetical protein ACFE04_022669 [Oxalis oulophora]
MGSRYAYDDGLTEEIVVDSDRVSYQEMKGILITRGHVEANFRTYFKPGRRTESDVHDSTTAQSWFEKLAPPPLSKGHAHFRSTGLMYHDPQWKKGLTASGIKKMWATSSENRGKGKKRGQFTQ